MAITTNKILLKDSQGNILLPITRSVITELSAATKEKFAYLDEGVTKHHDNVDSALSYLHDWQGRQDLKLNNLIGAINDELPGAFTAENISFDNSYYADDESSPLYPGTEQEPTYTNTVQDAIMALNDALTTTMSDVEQVISTAGVSSAIGSGVISVQGDKTGENGVQQGNLNISLQIDNQTLVQDETSYALKVGYISANQVNVTKGSGDAVTVETLDTTIADINERLSGAATEGNIQALEGRVTTVEGQAATALTNSQTISLTKDANAGNYAAVYTFTSYNGTETKINIPKDQFLKSAEYVATTPQDGDPDDYPAIVFTWVLDNDPESTSPDEATTVIPVADLIASADTKAEQALTILGVTKDSETGNITVPAGSSTAISGKTSVEGQIQGLDYALQSVETTANSALQGVNVNGIAGNKDASNVAYITIDGTNVEVGEFITYDTTPAAISYTDSVATAISKLIYQDTQLANAIKLDYIQGSEIEPITYGFAGINY